MWYTFTNWPTLPCGPDVVYLIGYDDHRMREMGEEGFAPSTHTIISLSLSLSLALSPSRGIDSMGIEPFSLW